MKMDKPSKCQRYVLGIDEWVVTKSGGEIICYGLGSCIGVFLYDKLSKLAAGAHVAWSNDINSDNHILDEMISHMFDLGANKFSTGAILTGGANTIKQDPYKVAVKNVEHIKNKIDNRGIKIISEDLGGRDSRTVLFDVLTRTITVKKPSQNLYKI